MRQSKWGFFPYDALDYKAAQAWLDKKAEAGWVLDKVCLKLFARFVPAEGRIHCVDLDLNTDLHLDPDTGEDYLQLCADAGWESVAKVRRMRLFRSKPGTRPAPIQSDESMEAERFRKKLVRKELVSYLIVLLLYLALLALLFSSRTTLQYSRMMTTYFDLLLIPIALFMVFYVLWSCFFLLRGFIRSFRAGGMSAWSRPGSRVMSILFFAVLFLAAARSCLGLAESAGLGVTVDAALSHFSGECTATPELCQSYPVLTAADLGLEYSEDSRYLNGRRSLLVPSSLDYSEIADGENGSTHILTTERYECASAAAAKGLFAARRQETTQRHNFTWGPLEWSESTTDYGFDQFCTAEDGSYLLLREGRVVVLVGATGFDLTEYLDVIRQRLELDA